MTLSTIEVQTPRGNTINLIHRDETTDLSTIGAIFNLWGQLHDEYGFGDLHPRTFLDIGGHIGTATVSVLVDNPDCRAVIIEPLPENVDMIRRNLESARVADRATVVQGAIGSGSEQRVGYTLARLDGDFGDRDKHRYVGSPVPDDYDRESIVSAVYPMGDLVDLLDPRGTIDPTHPSGKRVVTEWDGRVDLGKIDCEGCEWIALKDPAAKRIDRWVGEYHGSYLGSEPKNIAKYLGKRYAITMEAHDHGATGMFTAVAR